MPILAPEPQHVSALPTSGDLSTTSGLQLYFLAASTNETGLLSFRLPDREIQVAFRKGVPERVDSSHPSDSLGRFVLAERLVDANQLNKAERGIARFDGDLLSALLGLQLLDPNRAFESLARQAADLLAKAVTSQTGSFTFQPQEFPAYRSIAIANKWELLVEVVRRMPLLDLRQRLSPIADVPVEKTLGPQFTSELRLTPQEARALSRVDGSRSLKQLIETFPQDAEALHRLLFLLKELQALSLHSPAPTLERKTPNPFPAERQEKVAEPAKPNIVPPPPVPVRRGQSSQAPSPPIEVASKKTHAAAPAPAPIRAPATAKGHEEELRELRARVAKLKEQNHFQVLGINENADGSAVRSAYFELAKLVHPDTLPPNATEEMVNLRAQIFAAVGEAYRKLLDQQSRENYVESLKSGAAEQVDIAQILRAEDLFRKGCALIGVRRYSEALKCLDEAIQNNSEEGEFYAWRGYAKFLSATHSSDCLRDAQRDLLLAVKKNDRSAPSYYLMGEVARIRGDTLAALKHYKRALELKPDYIEPLRQIRFLSSKH
jgi:tetratricopeptide (TPR) repeat protein